jgi:hypothetical protein
LRFVRDNLATIVCGILVCAFVVASTLITYRARRAAASPVAVVHDADGRTYELPLATDAELAVTTERGHNVVRVKDGACSMAEADCPTGACLRQRPITRPGEQIICLPHELWIEVVQPDQDMQGAEGASMDTGAVSYDDAGNQSGADADVDLVAR